MRFREKTIIILKSQLFKVTGNLNRVEWTMTLKDVLSQENNLLTNNILGDNISNFWFQNNCKSMTIQIYDENDWTIMSGLRQTKCSLYIKYRFNEWTSHFFPKCVTSDSIQQVTYIYIDKNIFQIIICHLSEMFFCSNGNSLCQFDILTTVAAYSV